MTVEDLADYCQFKDCEISLGNPEVGFIHVDGTGVKQRNNYHRYLSHNELASLPSPKKVLAKASTFRVQRGEESQILSRQEFQVQLEVFRHKVGIE